MVFGFVAFSGLAARADARCAPISLTVDARQSPFVVEAVLERAGEVGQLRTMTVWKGGASAPAQFTLDARQGRAWWPWHEPQNVGHRYLLFLRPVDGGGFTVRRCGASGELSDGRRAELRALGLRPQER